MKNSLEMIFERLGLWTKYPAYKLEQRIDIYFSFFLKEILVTAGFNQVDNENVFPEFPIKISKTNNHSNRADFMCVSDNKIILVELKTSQESIDGYNDKVDEGQINRYKNIQGQSWVELQTHLNAAAKGSSQKEKYRNFLAGITATSISRDYCAKVVYIVPGRVKFKGVKISGRNMVFV